MMSPLRLFAFALFALSASCVVCSLDVESSAFSSIRPDLSSLLNRRRRALLTTVPRAAGQRGNGDACTWDEAKSECRVSLKATAEQLSQAESEYARFMASFAECKAADDKEACDAVGKCLWDPHSSRCLHIAFHVGYEDSPCVVDAPAAIQSIVSSERCVAYMTQLECYQDLECGWDQIALKCGNDDFKAFFGVSLDAIMGAADAVIDYKVDQLLGIFPTVFNTSDPGFSWDDVLKWDVPQTDCPAWSDPLVCIYVDGVFKNLATGFYCGGKYSKPMQFRGCIRDPLCVFHLSSAECRAPEASYLPGAREGLKGWISASALAVDKEIMLKVLDCNEIEDQDECTGDCQWNVREDFIGCAFRLDKRTELLAAPGKNGTDPVCTYAAALAKSGCMDLADTGGSGSCNQNPNCEMQLDGDCTGSFDYLVSVAMEKDLSLKASYSILQARCMYRTTKTDCDAATFEDATFVY